MKPESSYHNLNSVFAIKISGSIIPRNSKPDGHTARARPINAAGRQRIVSIKVVFASILILRLKTRQYLDDPIEQFGNV